MDDIKKIASQIAKNIKKLQKANENALNEIMEHDPETVAELITDNKSLVNAFKEKNLSKIIDIQTKYADKINK